MRAAGSSPAGGLSNLIDEVYLLITTRPSPSVRAQQRSGGAMGRSQPDSKWRPSELPVADSRKGTKLSAAPRRRARRGSRTGLL